ncbi:hypothetical protein LCGC14_2054080, partial [marine sediment metagenome]
VKIDEEFYEPEVLGGDTVIVQTDYFFENPYRYLIRYNNPNDGRDLLLLAADHGLDYTDHLKLIKYTKNT